MKVLPLVEGVVTDPQALISSFYPFPLARNRRSSWTGNASLASRSGVSAEDGHDVDVEDVKTVPWPPISMS